jgi:hypothetical protein
MMLIPYIPLCVQYNSLNPETDTPAVVENSPEFSTSVPMSTVVLSPDFLSPTASTMKTPDSRSPGHLASQVETEETPENIEGCPDASEPAVEHDKQME